MTRSDVDTLNSDVKRPCLIDQSHKWTLLDETAVLQSLEKGLCGERRSDLVGNGAV